MSRRTSTRQTPELLIWMSWYRLRYIEIFIGPKW